MNTVPDWLHTGRLALRRFTPDDLDTLCALYGDERVARHVGGVKSPVECALMLRERILDYYAAHPGLGVWLTCLRTGGAPIGLHLLNHIRGESYIQVGYLLAVAHWGRGYATEGAHALLHYGFALRGLARIVAITDPDNTASQHVLVKCGLERRGERVLAHPSYAGKPLAWFELEAEAWRGRRPASPAPVLWSEHA